MTTAIKRRVDKLEQAFAGERPKEPVRFELVALHGEPPIRAPWIPGSVVTRIELVPLTATTRRPNDRA